MTLFQLKPSFAGGELTPALYGRTDLAKYDVGAAKIVNALVLRYGGVSRRPGLRYVTTTYGNRKARLIPFKYSSNQNYIIEITAGAFRFATPAGMVLDGSGNIYAIGNSFTEAELPYIKYTQSADTVFLTHPNHAPMTLTRYGAASWGLATMDLSNGPFDDSNTTGIKIAPSGTTGNVTLTANGAYFTAAMVGSLIRLGHTIPSSYAKGNPLTAFSVVCPPGGTVYVESFGFWDGSFTLSKYDSITDSWVNIRTQSGNRSQNYNFTETNESENLVTYRVTSSEFNTDIWTGENEKQRGYVTLQSFSQDYYGIARITGVASATIAYATVVRDLGYTTYTSDFSLYAWSPSKGYPSCAGFFEDRLVFAGSASEPQTYWTSKTGDYYNFGQSIPSADDDAVIGTLSNGQMNGIKAIITFGEMLMMTSGGEYKVGGGSNAFTGSNQQSKPQEYRGINELTPVVVGNRIVYVQQQGCIVRDLGYQYDVDKYTGEDVSLLASHLFEGHTIVSITYQQVPNSIVWCVRDDGVLLGMTYIKEQDVYAWHEHTTDGKFIDVCSIAGSTEDELWCVVLRNGTYCLEKMEAQIQPTSVSDQYFVDSGITVTGTVKTVTGLNHLEGKTVSILADGNVMPEQVVSGGAITLDNTFSTVTVGLPYETELKTMPIEISGNDGSYASRKKRIQNMMIMFKDSRGGLYGVNEGSLDEIKWRSNEPYGTPIGLFTGKKTITLPQSNNEQTLELVIKQKDPLPINILSIVPEVVPGG